MTVKVTVDDRELIRLIRQAEAVGRRVYIVADGVEYGVYQELGTRYMAGKHFMRSACEAVRNWFVSTGEWRGIERDVTTVDKLLRQAAFMVEGEAKVRAPFETGALRASIHVVQEPFYEFEIPRPRE